jgi:hypothetical protein
MLKADGPDSYTSIETISVYFLTFIHLSACTCIKYRRQSLSL